MREVATLLFVKSEIRKGFSDSARIKLSQDIFSLEILSVNTSEEYTAIIVSEDSLSSSFGR